MSQRVAIIGAGPCGLSQLVAFSSAGDSVPEQVCFEKQDDWGGLWNYTWRTGIDEHGEPVHGSMYRYLWSNGPKECLEFADYSFDEHFGQPIPSFPPREPLADYIFGRAKKHDLRGVMQLQHVVRDVSWSDSANKFSVTVDDMSQERRRTEDFDYVVVATGHFSIPNVPYFKGMERFPGRVLHGHDFREAREFSGQNVLIVGASYSAEDIGLQIHKYGAKSVTLCWRTQPMDFKWPEGMDERQLLTEIKDSTIHFKDGSAKDFDAIVLCTGYKHNFPFLADDLKLKTHNRLYPPKLYKSMFWHDNPRLIYLGMQDQFYTFSMFDAQAWYARDVMLGRIKLPSKDEMAADIDAWVAREEKLEDPYQQIDFQADYIRDLVKDTDYPKFDIDLTVAAFKEWEHDKMDSIVGYRNKAFKSPVTGTMAPTHHTQWLEAMDDSMAAFLEAGRS
ncbi:MAG: NAD(P)/FAD-dependent oxidoreductase [Hyphomicrobiaceae bacterium]